MNLFQDCYGFDLLSLFLILLWSIFNIIPYTRILGIVCLVLALYRAFSKKVYKRREEYHIFYTHCNKILNKFNRSIPPNLPNFHFSQLSFIVDKLQYKYNQHKLYKITKCPNCKQKLRLPRGKGKIVVTCKRCANKFDFRT